MHPIINKFINTGEPLELILEKYHDKNQYLESIFFKLSLLTNTVNVQQKIFLNLDKAILKGHQDTNVYLLFISYAISFASKRKEIERAKVFQAIGESLSLKQFNPVLQSYFMISIGILKCYNFQLVEGPIILTNSIKMINKDSPRYKPLLLILASVISMTGRLKELGKQDIDLINSNDSNKNLFICANIKLNDCIFNSQIKDGYTQLELYKQVFNADAKFLIEGKKNLLKILEGDFNHINYQTEQFKIYSNVCLSLSHGNFDDANKYFQLLEKGRWPEKVALPFKEYFPVHIELCLKNKGKALLFLREIQEAVGYRYFDDFFLTRIQLIEANHEGAKETFSRLMKNINRFDAINRLAFEMQFAKEMKASDIVLLMNKNADDDVLDTNSLKKENPGVPSKVERNDNSLIGNSSAIKSVKNLISKFATIKKPVLITGETGTGKELVSRAIHAEGPNPDKPFLAINCGALSESLLQSELFGYEAGTFTGAQKERKGIFEVAGKGTVFLDEFGDISPKLQVSLLRVLESNEIRLIGGKNTRQIECKIVIATNTDLHQAVKNKKFREDLLFRLSRFDINLPPLRERASDIPLLINYFLEKNLTPNGVQIKLSAALMNVLVRYKWPGNIRELKNELERLILLHPDKEIFELEDFDFSRLQGIIPNLPIVEKILTENENSSLTHKKLAIDSKGQILEIVQRGSKVDQRHTLIKEVFQQYKKLTRRQIMEITSVSSVTATKDLETLCQSGFITRKTPTKSPKSDYFIWVE